MKRIPTFVLCAAVAAVLGSGCQTQMPKASGFLSDYSTLKKVNDSTWDYIDVNALAGCNKFTVPPVKIMVSDYWGGNIGADQREKIAEQFRQKIVSSLSRTYQVVNAPGANVGEVRVAITRAYRVGNSLAIGVEAEVDDSMSHKQLAALTGTRVGAPEMGMNTNVRSINDPSDPGTYMAPWWNRPALDELLNSWADQITKVIDTAHGK